jgi:hypothetical protein
MSLAATIPGVAQSSMSSPKTQPLEDPTGKYPKPPFNKSIRPERASGLIGLEINSRYRGYLFYNFGRLNRVQARHAHIGQKDIR